MLKHLHTENTTANQEGTYHFGNCPLALTETQKDTTLTVSWSFTSFWLWAERTAHNIPNGQKVWCASRSLWMCKESKFSQNTITSNSISLNQGTKLNHRRRHIFRHWASTSSRKWTCRSKLECVCHFLVFIKCCHSPASIHLQLRNRQKTQETPQTTWNLAESSDPLISFRFQQDKISEVKVFFTTTWTLWHQHKVPFST